MVLKGYKHGELQTNFSQELFVTSCLSIPSTLFFRFYSLDIFGQNNPVQGHTVLDRQSKDSFLFVSIQLFSFPSGASGPKYNSTEPSLLVTKVSERDERSERLVSF